MKTLFVLFTVVALLMCAVAFTPPVSAQDAQLCDWGDPISRVLTDHPISQDASGYSLEFVQIGTDCQFAYVTVAEWLPGDVERPTQTTFVVIWNLPEGRLFSTNIEHMVSVEKIHFSAGEENSLGASFFFASMLPSPSFYQVSMDLIGRAAVSLIEQEQVPSEIIAQWQSPSECGFPSRYEMWVEFAESWSFTSDVYEVNQGPMVPLSSICDAALVTFEVTGVDGADGEPSFNYAVDYYLYKTLDGQMVISRPISDGENDFIRYPLSYTIDQIGLHVTDWFLNGLVMDVTVNSGGLTGLGFSRAWSYLIFSAQELDSYREPNALDPDITFLDIALQLPDTPPSTLSLNNEQYYQSQVQFETAWAPWVCLNDDCSVQMLTIFINPNNQSGDLSDDYRWNVFAWRNADGDWKLSQFTRLPGTLLVYGHGVELTGEGSMLITTCSVEGLVDDSELIWTYHLLPDGRVGVAETVGECPYPNDELSQ